MPSFSFVVRDSNVGEEAGLEREGAQEQLRGTGGECSVQNLCDSGDQDTLPEWSKGVDSSSTSASCVGSNPTAVTAGEAFLDSATHGCAMTME